MAYEKGHSKFGGRKKGTRNKASEWGRELAQAIIGNAKYQKMLAKRLRNFDVPLRTEEFLWKYAFGMPLDPNRASHSEPKEESIEQVLPAVEETDDDDEEDDDEDDDEDEDEDNENAT